MDVSLLPLAGIIILCGLAVWRLASYQDRLFDIEEAWTIASGSLKARQDDR